MNGESHPNGEARLGSRPVHRGSVREGPVFIKNDNFVRVAVAIVEKHTELGKPATVFR
jgi:hypothetical protein